MKKLLVALLCLIPALVFAQREAAYPLQSSLWETNTISVSWENPTEENRVYREWVQSAIRETWEKHCAVRFTDWCPSSKKRCDIRILISDEGPHTKGLGNRLQNVPGGMVLNFTFKNWSQGCAGRKKEFCIKAIAVHEFGHALGLAHEQNRDDCKFDNCLEKEQGTDGDWYITPCDLNSIMNYCNPRRNETYELSQYDIYAVKKLYGSNEKSAAMDDMEIVYTSRQLRRTRPGSKRISHEFKVYISAENKDQIASVTYHLHNTFRRRTITVVNNDDNFGLGLRVWGEFEITADVHLRSGVVRKLKKELEFQ